MCLLRALLLVANVASVISFICTQSVFASGPSIQWEIENRFRYFKRASDFRDVAQVYQGLKTAENPRPPALQLEKALERSVMRLGGADDRLDGWAVKYFEHTCGREPDHTHSSCKMENGEPYLEPVTANLILNADGIVSEKCEWRIDGAVVEEKLCNGAVARNIKYNDSHEIKLTPSNGAPLTATIFLKDILIVSFGDSFSSGEGNPEKPVRGEDPEEKPVRFSRYSFNDYANSSNFQKFPVREDLNIVADNPNHFFHDLAPKWTNTQCHRSLYSQHTKAALQYALEHPHLTVTFLNYSCTGAEVYEGILNAWWGRDDIAPENYDDAPQLVKALRDLCKDSELYKNTEWALHNRGGDEQYNSKPADFPECASFVRRPDAILLSIGGNDVGFARMIANAAIYVPTVGPLSRARSWIYGLWRWASGPQDFETGLRLAKTLIAPRYQELDGMLQRYLGVASEKVVLSAYPQISYDENGRLCKPGKTGMDVHAIFGMNDKKTFSQSRDFGNQFHQIMKNAADNRHWLFADQHISQDGAPNNFANDAVGVGHGICAAGPTYSDEGVMKFPRPRPGTTPPMKWIPFQPENWKPYSPRNRWFVTPNDAFLATNYHDANLAHVDDPIQPLYAATLSGSFHPNALGHAAVADSVLIKLRQVFPDYEN